MPFLVRMKFNGPAGSGWTETVYTLSGISTRETALAAAAELAAVRVSGLASVYDLSAVTVSDVAVLNDWAPLGSGGSSGLYGDQQVSATEARDAVETAILLAVRSDTGNRQWWIRGCPDSWYAFTAGGRSVFTAPMTQFVARMRAALVNKFALRVISESPPVKFVTGVIRAPSSDRIAVRVPGHGYAEGASVRIRGARFVNPEYQVRDAENKHLVNRVHPVIPLVNLPAPAEQLAPADWFEVPQSFELGVTPAYVSGGKVQLREYAYETIRECVAQYIDSRQTGGPTYRRRGRYISQRRR